MSENNIPASHKNKLSMKAMVAILIGSPLLVILICSIAITITAKNLEEDTTAEAVETVEYALAEPAEGESADENDVIKLIDTVLNADDVKLSFVPGVNATLTDCSLDDSKKNLLSFAVGKTGSNISGEFFDSERYSSTYGYNTILTNAIYPKDNTEITFEKNDNDEFIYTYIPEEAFSGLFVAEDAKMLSDTVASCAKFLSADTSSFVTSEKDVQMRVKADGVTGKIKEIAKVRTYVINYTGDDGLTFTVELAATGTFNITFAGIEIEQDTITIHDNGYDNLTITANVDENAAQDEFSVEFVSSDPSVCTVDENGTVEAVKESDTPVTITITLKYLGETYTDSCLVYVTNDETKTATSSAFIGLNLKEVK